jgi:hypothetical protein
LAPAARRTAAADAACPTQMVATSGAMNRMVSWMAKNAVMSPPGLLMYSEMSRSAASDSRWRSCAITRLATLSSMAVPRNTMRSESRRE